MNITIDSARWFSGGDIQPEPLISGQPYTVKLISYWGMSITNSTNSPLNQLPWAFLPLALAMIVFGYLHDTFKSLFAAAVGAYLTASIPLINTHAALGGYADLWMTTAIFSTVAMISYYFQKQKPGFLLVAAISIAAVFTIKETGAIFSGFILMCCIFTTLSHMKAFWVGACLTLTGLTVIVTSFRVDLAIPGFGNILIDWPLVQIFSYPRIEIEFHNAWEIFSRGMLQNNNWHPLYYLIVATLFVAIQNLKAMREKPYQFLVLNSIVLVGLVVFLTTFTQRFYEWGLDSTTTMRILMYASPCIVVLAIENIVRFTSRGSNTVHGQDDQPHADTSPQPK